MHLNSFRHSSPPMTFCSSISINHLWFAYITFLLIRISHCASLALSLALSRSLQRLLPPSISLNVPIRPNQCLYLQIVTYLRFVSPHRSIFARAFSIQQGKYPVGWWQLPMLIPLSWTISALDRRRDEYLPSIRKPLKVTLTPSIRRYWQGKRRKIDKAISVLWASTELQPNHSVAPVWFYRFVNYSMSNRWFTALWTIHFDWAKEMNEIWAKSTKVAKTKFNTQRLWWFHQNGVLNANCKYAWKLHCLSLWLDCISGFCCANR